MSAGTCSANPRITPSGSLSASQREIWTTAGASSGSGCSSNSSAVRSTRPGRPVVAHERAGAPLAVGRDEAGGVQHGAHRLAVEVLVLRGEHVDRGRDHDDPLAVQPLPRERLAREHVGVGLGDVGLEERPRLAGELVRVVEPDVAAPDHRGALRLERVEHARRLRVVQDHHVALVHARRDLRDIARQHALVLRLASSSSGRPSPSAPCSRLWIRLVTGRTRACRRSPPSARRRRRRARRRRAGRAARRPRRRARSS